MTTAGNGVHLRLLSGPRVVSSSPIPSSLNLAEFSVEAEELLYPLIILSAAYAA